MGEFNSDDHYIYYCGQKSLRRNGVALMVNKRVQNSVLGCNLKMTERFIFVSKANHYSTVIQVYASTTTAKEAQVEWFCEDYSWRSAWKPTPVFLPGESHGQRSLEGYGPQGRKELDTTEATYHTYTHMQTYKNF